MHDDDAWREERAIYAIVMAVLAPVAIAAAVQRLDFDGGTTLCLIGAAAGAIGVAASVGRRLRLRLRLPRATARSARRARPRGSAAG